MSDQGHSSNQPLQPEGLAGNYIRTLQELTTSLQRTQEEQAGIRTVLENLIAKSVTNQTQTVSSSQSAAKIDLVEFTGADRSIWPTWQLQAYGRAISSGPDPMVQFYAVFNKLKDTAAKNVTPWVSQNLKAGTATFEGLLQEMEKLYGDPAAKTKALTNLKSMKQQERESFANFYPKFEKELANAGVCMADAIKVMFLRTALNSRFRDCLPKTKNYSQYEDLILDLQTAASAMANEEALHGRRTTSRVPTWIPEPSAAISEAHTPMDWMPTISNQAQATSAPNQRPRAQRVSRETLQARRDAGCCVRCGSSRHYQRNFLYLQPVNEKLGPINNHRAVRRVDPAMVMAEPEIDVRNCEGLSENE